MPAFGPVRGQAAPTRLCTSNNGRERETVSADSRNQERVRSVSCQECGCLSGLRWHGWRAYRADDPETGEPPVLTFYCPACAAREFGATPRL
jgi:hypothetical protein